MSKRENKRIRQLERRLAVLESSRQPAAPAAASRKSP
nr:MAG TPA: zipper dimerization domain transcription factor-like protein [Caudoviricetes sp.]